MNFHHEGEYAEIRVLDNALAFIIVASPHSTFREFNALQCFIS